MLVSDMLHIVEKIPDSMRTHHRSPENKAIFYCGGFAYDESGKPINRSRESIRLFGDLNGMSPLCDTPYLKEMYKILEWVTKADKCKSHAEYNQSLICQLSKISSALYALEAKGDTFYIASEDPPPNSIFRTIELPILMIRKPNLKTVGEIVRGDDGKLEVVFEDKIAWFNRNRDTWMKHSIDEFYRAKEGYRLGEIPEHEYQVACKNIGTEIDECMSYLTLKPCPLRVQAEEGRRLKEVLKVARTIDESALSTVTSQGKSAGR